MTIDHGALERLPDGVLVAGPDGRVTDANTAAARLLGLDGLVGRPLAEALSLTDTRGRRWVEANRPYDGLSTRTGIPEQSWVSTTGQELLVTARLTREEHLGPVTGVALVIRSGRGRARLDRERSDLVATVSHELRSPLSGVKGFVQVMLNRWDQLQDDQKKLMLTTVHSDADRLSRLIAELLDVARIDTGRLSIAQRPVDADHLLERAIASVQAATARRLRHQRWPGDLPRIWADPDKFTQVVTNLLENAVKHGEGEVTVSTEPAGDGVRVVVEDEGPGIPGELRQRVRTKYWTRGSAGSGLGLYIASGLVAAHGGRLEIGEAATGGARVVTDWPCVPV